MTDASGTNSYAYYNNSSLLRSEDGPFSSDTVGYGYVNGRLSDVNLTQPNSSSWGQTYVRDAARRIASVSSPAGTFSYTLGGSSAASSLIKKVALPNGSYITNTYDSLGRLTSTYLRDSVHNTLNSHAYGYNAGNLRTSMTNAAGNFWSYTYDSINQLTTALGKESGGVTNRLHEQFGYWYDAAGNLAQRTNTTLGTLTSVASARWTGFYFTVGSQPILVTDL